MLEHASFHIGFIIGFVVGIIPMALFLYKIETGNGKWENKKYIWTRFNKRLDKIA